ncbi:oligopeptide:H+ symporter [Thiotrichales bacterium 19S11-10]|nr:oligopeptide:H+ symporter [Thiotrichales bacterium 19S11-10]
MSYHMNTEANPNQRYYPLPFWVAWAIELWERFGFYGMQAIIALYFVHSLGYSSQESFYIFGSFSAFCYGFVWIGGLIGDRFLGAKRSIIIGAIFLMFSYAAMALATKETIFFALAGVIVGNALFKANPSSLISKIYGQGNPQLDAAMTMYYVAVNIGSLLSMSITPIIAQNFGWHYAFWVCTFGLLLGLINFCIFLPKMKSLSTTAGKRPFSIIRTFIVIFGAIIATIIIGNILEYTTVITAATFIISGLCFIYFLYVAFQQPKDTRNRMIIALVLMLQAIVFFTLYQQMPTSLNFFAAHNVDRTLGSWEIPAAEFQLLNPLVIVLMAPVLAFFYRKTPGTHATKFCFGMTLCALAFLVLYIPQFTATDGFASPWWLVLSYWLQSTGELLVSALGLAMVAELCPAAMSGFVMGIWFLTSMLAGPIGAWVGNMTQPVGDDILTPIESMSVYSNAFGEIGLATAIIAMIMWAIRPILNRYTNPEIEQQQVSQRIFQAEPATN